MPNAKELRSQIHHLVREYVNVAIRKESDFIPGETHVPVSGKLIGKEEIGLAVDASLDGWFTTGRFAEKFEKNYPIKTNPIYCYRSPYYLFTSWVSSNRVKRSKSLSRMFKYDSTKYLKRENLYNQFEDARNDNEVSFIKELGTWKYHEFEFDEVTVHQKEEKTLLKLIKENKANAKYWSKRDMMYRFEHIVSNPEKFVDYLGNRLNIEFDDKLLLEGIILMDKRPLDQVVELDIKKAEKTLVNLGCSEETLQIVVEEQKNYINEL